MTVNGGRTWGSWYNQPTAQFYRVNVDDRTPYHVHGNMQDLGTASGPSNSLSRNGITRGDWHDVEAPLERHLAGSAIVHHSPDDAIVRAVLDAANRRLALLMVDHGDD